MNKYLTLTRCVIASTTRIPHCPFPLEAQSPERSETHAPLYVWTCIHGERVSFSSTSVLLGTIQLSKKAKIVVSAPLDLPLNNCSDKGRQLLHGSKLWRHQPCRAQPSKIPSEPLVFRVEDFNNHQFRFRRLIFLSSHSEVKVRTKLFPKQTTYCSAVSHKVLAMNIWDMHAIFQRTSEHLLLLWVVIWASGTSGPSNSRHVNGTWRNCCVTVGSPDKEHPLAALSGEWISLVRVEFHQVDKSKQLFLSPYAYRINPTHAHQPNDADKRTVGFWKRR